MFPLGQPVTKANKVVHVVKLTGISLQADGMMGQDPGSQSARIAGVRKRNPMHEPYRTTGTAGEGDEGWSTVLKKQLPFHSNDYRMRHALQKELNI